MVGGYTQIKKLNNHYKNKMQIQNSLGINNTNLQEGQLTQNNILNPNNITGGRSQMTNNYLINRINLNNSSVNLIANKNNKNKFLIDTQEIDNMSLKKNRIIANKNYYYLTDYNIQKNRNISPEIKDKPNLFLSK